MENPEVSVIIPTYNDAATLDRAVESCLSQSMRDLEVIVVDDASTDSTHAVAEALAERDSRVRLVSHEQNRQALEARRTGLESARGSYVLFLDADDWLDPQVCERALVVQRDTTADIVNFSIVPEYTGASPAPEVVCGRAQMYAAPDLVAEGPEDILHATYRDDRLTWSLCGKLLSADLARQAFALVPAERMFQCEDAYLYFVVASLADVLVSRSDLPAYHYSMGVGGTRADACDLTAERYDQICAGELAVERVASFLDERELREVCREDYEALRDRILADPVLRFPHAVTAPDRPAALDALLGRWPVPEAVSALAARHWDEPVCVIEAALGARSLARGTDTVHTVAAYYHTMGTGGAEHVTRDLLVLWRSMGFGVVLLVDEGGGDPAFRLPEGVALETLPSCFEATGGRYRVRAEALSRALSAHGVDMLVYCQWLSPTLPWDILLAKASGVSVTIHTHGTFSVLLGYDVPDFLALPPIYRMADAVVCLSAADRAFWENFNRRVYLTQNPMPQACLQAPAAALGGHTVLWVGRVEVDKDPLSALSVMGKVIERVPDARLLMVGPASERARADLEEAASRLGIADALEIAGPVDEEGMPEVYRRASVFLLTSRYKGWPLALAEAKASGVPCVTYDMAYLTLLEGHRGVLVAPMGDEDALAREVAQVLLDPGYARRLGAEGRAHVTELAGFDYVRLWGDVFAGVAPETSDGPGSGPSRLMWDTLLSTARLKLVGLNGERAHVHELEQAIAGKDSELAALRVRVAFADEALARVTNSISFKAGRALTWSARHLRDAVRHAPKHP